MIVQDLYNILDSYVKRNIIESYDVWCGECTTEKGYLSPLMAEVPFELLELYRGEGARKGELYVLQPHESSVQYRYRQWIYIDIRTRNPHRFERYDLLMAYLDILEIM